MTAPVPTVYQNGQNAVSGDQLNTFLQGCLMVSQLRALVGVPGMTVMIAGFNTPGDGGAGPFYWNATGNGPDDGGVTTIQPQQNVTGVWSRLYILQNPGTAGPNSVVYTDALGNISAQKVLIAGGSTSVALQNALGIAMPLLMGFGGVPGGVVDNGVPQAGQTQSPFALMNAYLRTINNAPLEVEFGGQVFATSQPWAPPNNCSPVNGTLKALASTAWTSGLTSSIVAPLMLTGSGAAPKNFTVDANRQAYWACLNTQVSGFSPSKFTLLHWLPTNPDVNDKYSSGGLLIANGKINGGEGNTSHQYQSSDAEQSTPNVWSGYAIAFVSSADCHPNGWTLSTCAFPIFIDERSYAGVFTNCHPFNGGSGTVIQDCKLMDYRGYDWAFSGFEWDSGCIILNLNSNSHAQSPANPRVTLGPSTWIQGLSNAAYSGYIRVRTTQSNTTLDNLVLTGPQTSKEGTLPYLWLETYGAQTGTATGTASGTTALTLSNVTGTPAIGNLVQGFGIPTDTTLISGSGTAWVMSNSATIPAGTFVTFNALTGSFASTVNVAGLTSVVLNPDMNGTVTNKMSSENYGGISQVYGHLLGKRATTSGTLTSLLTDCGCLVTVNTASETFTLANTMPQDWWCIVSTQATGGTTIAAGSGAQLNANGSNVAYLPNGGNTKVVCIANSDGASARFSIQSYGASVTPPNPSTITSPYTATLNGEVWIVGGTVTGITRVRGSVTLTYPITQTAVKVSAGDVVTVTQTGSTLYFAQT